MKKILIRHSALADLPVLIDLYRESREIMLSCGDVNQWKPGYPTEKIIRGDIAKSYGYCIEDGTIHRLGSFKSSRLWRYSAVPDRLSSGIPISP